MKFGRIEGSCQRYRHHDASIERSDVFKLKDASPVALGEAFIVVRSDYSMPERR